MPALELDLSPLTERQRKVMQGFALLVQIEAFERGVHPRHLAGVPFAKSFGVAWCQTSESTFERARGDLNRAGWLQPSGWLETPCRRTRLWLPGAQILEAAFPLRVGRLTTVWESGHGSAVTPGIA